MGAAGISEQGRANTRLAAGAGEKLKGILLACLP
jgi:hypothetical protein